MSGSYNYRAPLRDMRFVLERVLQAPASWAACAGRLPTWTPTPPRPCWKKPRVLPAKCCSPSTPVGDREGCTLKPTACAHPAGYAAAYTAFVQGGWPALPCSPDWGGQGLPLLVDAALREMLSACNHAWNMYPDLLHGAYETIKAHASDELKARYLPGVASGEILAAMALTEPQAGSDLGQFTHQGRAAARRQPAHHRQQDLHQRRRPRPDAADRAPGAVPPARCTARHQGHQPGPGAQAAARRHAQCLGRGGLEHKMGIHGSATCALRYEGATGWLVGEPNRGLAAMFLMMNSARLHVGLQGLGHQEMATQNAVRYALERVQMKAPIAQHPAMRHTAAAPAVPDRSAACHRLPRRAGAGRGRPPPRRGTTAPAGRAAGRAADARGQGLAHRPGLCTPPARRCRCWGGYGYVADYGIEQTLRDARIAMVYEGTNEIQAIDLLQRKVLADGGAALGLLLQELRAEASLCEARADGGPG
jgi:alkylation response protein AidB-like acyl-CoA dehydrogenase